MAIVVGGLVADVFFPFFRLVSDATNDDDEGVAVLPPLSTMAAARRALRILSISWACCARAACWCCRCCNSNCT